MAVAHESHDQPDAFVMTALQAAPTKDILRELAARSEACLVSLARIEDGNRIALYHCVSGRPILMGYCHQHLDEQIKSALGGE